MEPREKREFSLEERKMYARQQLVEGWDQETIKNSCALIIGVGALGCEIAKDLALMGIGKLILVDMDKIETSNLSRQMLFHAGDEGRTKVEVAAERLKLMAPFLEVEYYFDKLQNLPMDIYQRSDVIIAALDNVRARMDLNKIALRLKKPMVEGGTVGFEGHVQNVIPKGSNIKFHEREKVIDEIVQEKLWNLSEEEYTEYFAAQESIEKLEERMALLKSQFIEPVVEKVRQQVENEFNEKYSEDYLDQTACYRCLVPIPPPDDKLIAACTLKGIPRNRNHCVLKAELNFEKKYGRMPDLDNDEDIYKLMELAKEELELLRERVFKENVSDEQLSTLSAEEIQKWKINIRDTFGPNYVFEDMENILGNKIAAVQTVSSIIASIQSQEALKLIFRAKGRDIGPPMDPPYVNYSGIYGIFEQVPVFKREDCIDCGDIEGEENVSIVVPFNSKVKDIFSALDVSGYKLDSEKWMITNSMNKEILWHPSIPTFKDPEALLQSLKITSNDVVTLTPLSKDIGELEIKKYNVIVSYL